MIAGAGQLALADGSDRPDKTDGRAGRPPYPSSPVITAVEFDWTTHQRRAPGSDNWPLTWADDGHQYTAWGDGGGFSGTNSNGRVSLGVARIEGDWNDFHGHNVWGGVDPEAPAAFRGKSYGILSVGGTLYLWWIPDPLPHLTETRIAWSTDRGRTWQRTGWAFTFDDGVTIPTFLNFGKDNAGSRDDYVYSYFIRPRYGPGRSTSPLAYESGFDVHRPGAIDLARVPRDAILDREQYEFFAGFDQSPPGQPVQPRWTGSLADRQPVFEDPNGVGWNVSVVYSAGIKRYVLCTEHGRSHLGKLGMFDAPEPWGPWTTVLYEDAWGAEHVPVNTFYWSIPTKWISADGRDFTFVFTGRTENDSFNAVRGRFVLLSGE
jgi:hypothetical protein